MLFVCNAFVSATPQVKTIHIATEEWKNAAEKDLSGTYFDITRTIFSPQGYELKVSFVPYKRALLMVEKQEVDALFGTYSAEEENKPFLVTPNLPLDGERTIAIFKKSSVSRWEGEKSLANRKVAWILGYDYHNSLNVDVNLQEVRKAHSGLSMLKAGRIDFYIDAASDVAPLLNETKDHYQQETLLINNLYMAFANTLKGKLLAKIYDEEFIKHYQSGKIQQIYKDHNVRFAIRLP